MIESKCNFLFQKIVQSLAIICRGNRENQQIMVELNFVEKLNAIMSDADEEMVPQRFIFNGLILIV